MAMVDHYLKNKLDNDICPACFWLVVSTRSEANLLLGALLDSKTLERILNTTKELNTFSG
jgi:hypothetical protein